MARDSNSRLAYSTGGERPAAKGPTIKASRPAGQTRLRLEKRASGRLVTVVSGLPGTHEDVAALGRELRAACGTGGTERDGALELRGDLR